MVTVQTWTAFFNPMVLLVWATSVFVFCAGKKNEPKLADGSLKPSSEFSETSKVSVYRLRSFIIEVIFEDEPWCSANHKLSGKVSCSKVQDV